MIPATALLLWGHLLLIWMVAHYVISQPGDTPGAERATKDWRQLAGSIGRVAISTLLAGGVSESWWLAALMLFCGTVLVALRTQRPEWRGWERELMATAAFSWAALALIERQAILLRHPVMTMATSAEHIAVACLVSALFIFTLGGGTYIVRGVLTASGVPQAAGAPKDQERLKHGRWIGSLERAVLFVVLIAGSYEALGFIVAAKGLIRSRQFEKQRELTEYFLIGSLASIAVALATGTAARYLIQKFW